MGGIVLLPCEVGGASCSPEHSSLTVRRVLNLRNSCHQLFPSLSSEPLVIQVLHPQQTLPCFLLFTLFQSPVAIGFQTTPVLSVPLS